MVLWNCVFLDVPHETQLEISMEECRSVFHSGKYQYDGLSFSVSIDLQTSHSFVVNRSLLAWNQLGEENISCKTLGVYAHNE